MSADQIILTPAELAQVRNLCRKCGHPITTKYRFGSAATGWEHMVDECPTGVPSGVIVTPGDPCSRYALEGYGRTVLDCPTLCKSSCSFVAPVRWTALEGPRIELRTWHVQRIGSTENWDDVLVARASVEVLPVVAAADLPDRKWPDVRSVVVIEPPGWHHSRCWWPDEAGVYRSTFDTHRMRLDPLPVPGRDFVVLLHDLEVL